MALPLIYVDCEYVEKTLSLVPGRGGPVFPTRLHLLRLHCDPVKSARGVVGGTLGLRFGTKLDWTLLSNSLAQRSVLPFMHMVNLGLLFHQGFPGAGIMENKI